MLIHAIEGGMFTAQAKGDKDTVQDQHRSIKEKTEGLEVAVFDFTGEITFATEAGLKGKQLDKILDNRTASDGASAMLKNGVAPVEPVEDTLGGKHVVSMFRPILNGPRCTHCHAGSRKVLEGVPVVATMEEAVNAANSARNRSILFGVLGSLVLVFTMYSIMRRLVDYPIRNLTKSRLSVCAAAHPPVEITPIAPLIWTENDENVKLKYLWWITG